MAILGESFKPYVRNQINIRQEKLSSQYKDNDLLTYLTSKTSFLRLTSGVNVTNDILKAYDLPLSYIADNGLAKMCVLEGARFRASENSQPDFTSNVGYDNPLSSYGFLSNSDYGFVPPPGVTQATVKTLNRGTIREATIQLVCHNIQQFHVISILFLKLKYSLLLEWGHTMYYDNSGDLKKGYDIPNLSNDFLAGQTSQAEFLKKIESERERSNGNYDAFFGWVKNFQWEAQENGSYTITINAISTGDVIESLKLNVNLDPDNDKNSSGDAQTYLKSTFHKILGTIRKNPKLTGQFYMNGYNTGDGNCLNTLALAALTGLTPNYKEELDTNETTQKGNNILTDREAVQINFPDLQTSQDQSGKWQSNNQFYIKLGTLLRIIESFLLFYDTTKNILPPSGSSPSDTSQKYPPIFHVNHDFEINECLTTVNQLPVDPRVALIPLAGTSNATNSDVSVNVLVKENYWYNINYDITTNTAIESHEFKYSSNTTELPEGYVENVDYVDTPQEFFWSPNSDPTGTSADQKTLAEVVKTIKATPPPNDGQTTAHWIGFGTHRYRYSKNAVPQGNVGPLQYLGTEFRDGSPSQFIGKTMHIYINIDYIVSVLDNNIDKDGNVALQPFLTTLLSGVSTALGCINKFELDYDDATNTFFIVDSALVPIKYKGKNEVAKFNVNSLNPSANAGGSFVTNFGLKSDIYSSIGNAIAIGAQAGGNSLMSNSTAFSGFNSGIVDRFLTNKDNKNIKLNPSASVDQEAKIQARFNEFKVRLTATQFGTALNPANIDYFRSYVVDLLQHDLGYATTTNQIPGTVFIPLNLHLTMDGISGMRQYQVFDITENLLPKEYYDKVKFITTVIEHKIDTKGWETTVNTIGIPKKDDAKEITVIPKPITPVATSASEIKAKQLNTSASPKKVDTSGKCTPRPDGKGYYHTGFEPQFKTREPRSITIHHTAGEGSAQSIIYGVGECGRGADADPPWNEQGGIHWAIGIDGVLAQGIPENKRAIHGNGWNDYGIGIEVANIGMISGKNSQGIPKGPEGVLAIKNPVVVDLGFSFNGYNKWQEYTDEQVATLKGLISEILGRYPKIKDAIQGQNVYKHVWNLPGTPKPGDDVRSSLYGTYNKYGIFAHSTSKKIKSDMGPTPKIIKMLLSFGFVE